MMKLFHDADGWILNSEEGLYRLDESLDHLLQKDDPQSHLKSWMEDHSPIQELQSWKDLILRPPIGSQEVWAAGVTYERSREARKEESKEAGGGDFYHRVYTAKRPELFFKAPAYRVLGHGAALRVRGDSEWNVPEPELTLVISSTGNIVGYTIGNDMSSRDIEGENPLYLPQAKVYDGSCSLGPGILLTREPLPADTKIHLRIFRQSDLFFDESIPLSRLKRPLDELVQYLFRELSFPVGCFLMTGTGIVPPGRFSVEAGDRVEIEIDGLGTLTNDVSAERGS